MKVILVADVKNVGRKGSVVEVAEGYARNFLLPRGLAREATAGNVRSLEETRRDEERKEAKLREETRQLAEKVNGLSLVIPVKVGEGGRLFGSVNTKDIATALAGRGITIDKRKIELEAPLKALGSYQVGIHLGGDFTATVTVRLAEAE